MSSEELRLFDKVRVYLDEDYSSAENFTVSITYHKFLLNLPLCVCVCVCARTSARAHVHACIGVCLARI